MRLGPVLVIALGACSAKPDAPAQASAEAAPASRRSPAAVSDDRNITRADYIGPDACGECHAAQHAKWKTSLHRVMNANADEPGAVIAPVTGAAIAYKGGELRMSRDLAGLSLTATRGGTSVRYRVTRTIGKGHLQEYVGIEEGHDTEVRLPIGYWPRAGGWSMQPDFDPWLGEESFDPFAPVREPWAERCPWCHSTYPFAQRIARASGPRAVGHGLEQYYVAEAGQGPAGGSAAGPAAGPIERLDVGAQVTTGISCESCHLGGRAHAQGAPIQFLPRGATPRPEAPVMPTTFAAQRVDATVINTVCAQCHSGPSPRLPDGTALRNSSEALDLAASPCTGMKCTDCHDPHAADGMPDEKRAVATCIKCHAAQAVPQHAGTGHAATSCLDCHMPRVVMGVDRYVRTHRISSPTDPRILASAGPNACNLCHLDRPISWTLAELRAGWDVRMSPVQDAYGDDEASVGDVWLASASPAVRLIAAHAYARSRLGAYALADIRKGLTDRLPYVRVWTRFAVESIMAAPP